MGAAATGSRVSPSQLLCHPGSYNAGGVAVVESDQGSLTNLFTLLDQDLAEVVDDARYLAANTSHEVAAMSNDVANHISSQDLGLLMQCCKNPDFVRQTSFIRQTSVLEAVSATEKPPWLDQVIIFARQMSTQEEGWSRLPPANRTNFLGPLADAPMPQQAAGAVAARPRESPL